MKLSVGAPAPLFEGESLTGRRASLGALRGQTVLVKFYRFASCPVCNLHLREVISKRELLISAGITPVVLFHSPLNELERNMGLELPFDIVADPAKEAFRAYGVEASWGGMFSTQVMRDYARAMWAGIVSKPFGHEG
ncbi:MAG: redoxin domain-containing protein, partial [Chloroflexi bacterium]|nr:redoxin domain-containing protein [Chloroflexota bacterium]